MLLFSTHIYPFQHSLFFLVVPRFHLGWFSSVFRIYFGISSGRGLLATNISNFFVYNILILHVSIKNIFSGNNILHWLVVVFFNLVLWRYHSSVFWYAQFQTKSCCKSYCGSFKVMCLISLAAFRVWLSLFFSGLSVMCFSEVFFVFWGSSVFNL